jgi:hypothetical protein
MIHSQERSNNAMQQTTGRRRCASLRGAYVAADRERYASRSVCA